MHSMKATAKRLARPWLGPVIHALRRMQAPPVQPPQSTPAMEQLLAALLRSELRSRDREAARRGSPLKRLLARWERASPPTPGDLDKLVRTMLDTPSTQRRKDAGHDQA